MARLSLHDFVQPNLPDHGDEKIPMVLLGKARKEEEGAPVEGLTGWQMFPAQTVACFRLGSWRLRTVSFKPSHSPPETEAFVLASLWWLLTSVQGLARLAGGVWIRALTSPGQCNQISRLGVLACQRW